MKINRREIQFITPDGNIYPIKTIFETEKSPFCANCKNIIKNGEICYYCKLVNKYFCLKCYDSEDLICLKWKKDFTDKDKTDSHRDLIGVVNG